MDIQPSLVTCEIYPISIFCDIFDVGKSQIYTESWRKGVWNIANYLDLSSQSSNDINSKLTYNVRIPEYHTKSMIEGMPLSERKGPCIYKNMAQVYDKISTNLSTFCAVAEWREWGRTTL